MPMPMPMPVALALCGCLFFCVVRVRGGWIDPDTQERDKVMRSSTDGREYRLVMSDEFEREGRNLRDGHDPKWTALHKNDYTNAALQYYNADLVTTENGYLNITTTSDDITFQAVIGTHKHKTTITKNYQSGMVQSWNKFCFTGGIIEFNAKLPGEPYIGGMWPALWLLGNLARATFVSSSDNIWPWSYNVCNRGLQDAQRVSACDRGVHFGFHAKHGRGSPEIDILEAMPNKQSAISPETPIHKPYYSTSLQISPGVEDRPVLGLRPKPTWYSEGLSYGENSSVNIYFYGVKLKHFQQGHSYQTDAISANTNMSSDLFDTFHKYRLEWVPGDHGYLKWYTDDKFIYGIKQSTLNVTGADIPKEPMYILMNTAVSSTWGFPSPCPDDCPCKCFDCKKWECLCAVPENMCSNFPASFLIDYVRVYQAVDDPTQTVGCSTTSYPTSKFITALSEKYKDPDDEQSLKPVARGGAKCASDVQCGGPGCGVCHNSRCRCLEGWTGPECFAPDGYDDIQWETESHIIVRRVYVAGGFRFLGALAMGCFAVLISWKYIATQRRRREAGRGHTRSQTNVRFMGL